MANAKAIVSQLFFKKHELPGNILYINFKAVFNTALCFHTPVHFALNLPSTVMQDDLYEH